MTWWASGNARQSQGAQAREAGRLDRRILGTARAGVGPAPVQGVFIGGLVIVHGTGPTSGVFIYNGAPALGNPPQIAEVPSGVTTDPYGNAITSSNILMQGNVITMSAGIFRTAAAAPLVQLDGSHDAMFVYDASANLVDTITPVATTDGLGHTVYAGIVNYSIAVNAITQLLNGFLNVGTPGQIAGTGGAAPGQLGLASAGNPGVVRVDSGLTATGDTDAFVDVRSKNAQSSISAVAQRNIQLAGPLALSSEGSAPLQLGVASLYSDSNGFGKMISSVAGDTNAYSIASLFKQVSPRSQNFSAVAAANIGGLSAAVGIGTYIVRARLIIEWAALAGAPQMQFAGPAISQYDVSFKSQQSGTPATTNGANTTASGTVNGSGYNSGLIGITQAMTANGIFFDMDIWGMFTFTASGTLTLQAASSVAADVWTVISGFWEVSPTG